jgi:multidrug efflux pump subunit AcrA (membrane-fusion protein)
MRMHATILGTVLSIGSLVSAAERPSQAPNCRLANCQVLLAEEVNVPAQEAGLLTAIEAREGMLVQVGALLAQIDDTAARHQKQVAEQEHMSAQATATSEVNVRHARAASEVAAADYQSVVLINRRNPGTITQSEQRKKELELRTAELRIEQSELEQKIAGFTSASKAAEAASAEAAIDRRRVRAPLDGIVVEVNRQPGEWVQPGERIARIVRMDRLRIEGFVKAADFDASELDHRPVVVEARLARGRVEQFAGKIVFVDPQIESSGEFRVRAEVVNRTEGRQFLLRPGMRVDMQVDVELTANAAVDQIAQSARTSKQ